MGWSEVLFGNLWKHEEKLTSHLTFVVVVQLLSHVRLLATPLTAARQASLSISVPRSLLKLMPIELVMPSNHLIPCNPLLLLPSIFPSIRVFSNESVLRIRWPKYWSFSFSISPSNEYSGLISFRIDWFDLLAVQGTLKSVLQHHSSKTSILWHPAFFIKFNSHIHTSLVAQMVKHLSTMRGTQVQSLGREDPLEKEMATHSSTLASHGWRSLVGYSFNGIAKS